MCPHSWRVFFLLWTFACSDGCYCVLGNQQNKTQIMIKAEKFFLFVVLLLAVLARYVYCYYYIWVEMWCQSYRAKIAQGTNSHFILHDEMCVCALQTIPVVRNPLLSTLLHPPFPFFGPTNQLANQSAHLFIDIEQLQWQRRLCLNFPLQ